MIMYRGIDIIGAKIEIENSYMVDGLWVGITQNSAETSKGFHLQKSSVPEFCRVVYASVGLTFPTATPDLTAFQTALATLAEKHSSDQSIEMACIALFEEARKVGLLQPEADALDSVRTSLRDISNDPGLSVSERDKAKRALEAMS